MHRFLFIAAVALATTACSRHQDDDVPTGVTVPTAPPDAFYIGTWAQSQADCASAAWIIHPTSLQGPNGACKFTRITPVQTGYALAAECIWREHELKTTIQASYAQSAKALLLSGAPDGDIGLVACPATSQTP